VTEATAIQAAQYNRRLAAPWVVLTNGSQTLFTRDGQLHGRMDGRITDAPLDAPVHDAPLHAPPVPRPQAVAYWLDRGFLTASTSGDEWVALCNRLYKGAYPVRYSETPVPGWQAAVGGWGVCLNAGRLVAWNTERMMEFEGGDPSAWVQGL
jgi:hypothetical protein